MSAGSSLFDLKAELSRKEEQLKKKNNIQDKNEKRKPNKTFEKIHALTGKKKKKKSHQDKEETNIEEKEIDNETLMLYEKSKLKLEAKSKIYNKMEKGEMEDFENIYGETKFLVDFEQKTFEKSPEKNEEDNEKLKNSIYEADEQLREKLHAKWEAEQKEILEGPIHYENIKFDEIRELGTGYFAFSKNEEIRKKQMEELQNLRQDTKNIQTKKELLKNKRKLALEERLNKVKQKKLGIEKSPMDELNDLRTNVKYKNEIEDIDQVHENVNNPTLSDTNSIKSSGANINLTSNISSTTNTMSTSLPKTSKTVDNLMNECRAATKKNREWDKGKNSTFMHQSFVPQRPKQTSFEMIIKQKREERPEEFRPPNFY